MGIVLFHYLLPFSTFAQGSGIARDVPVPSFCLNRARFPQGMSL